MSERPGDGYPHWMAVAFHICLVLPTGLSVMTWNSELISHLADASSGESLFVPPRSLRTIPCSGRTANVDAGSASMPTRASGEGDERREPAGHAERLRMSTTFDEQRPEE